MRPEIIELILKAYKISYLKLLPAQKGYRSSSFAIEQTNQKLNLIIYKSEPEILTRIKNANKVGDFLFKQGLAARHTYSNQIIKISSPRITRYGCLYYYLPGSTIPWEAYSMKRLKALGQSFALMHAHLKALNLSGFNSVAQESIHINQRMISYFSDPVVSGAIKQKLKLKVVNFDFINILKITKKLPNQQCLHMDYVRGNVLFSDTCVSGILDFEKNGYGSTLLDIARTLAFLLVDCKYKSEEQIRKYFLLSGYIKHGQGEFKDYKVEGISLFESLINFYLMYDFYKFLRHNPYEFLDQNEHYIRTKAYLMKTGFLVKF